MDSQDNAKKITRVAYTQSNYRSPKVNPFTGTLSTNQDIQSKWVQSEGVFNRTAENYSKSLTRNFNSELKDSRNNSVISPSRGTNVLAFNFSRMVNSPPKLNPVKASENAIKIEEAIAERTRTKYNKIQRIVETWINETLKEAEYLNIPNIILKPQNKLPINRYGIDRLSLSNECLEADTIDRVYRTLFVYSTGFYEVIRNCLDHCKHKYTTVTNILRVYNILLEYACKTDYRSILTTLTEDHKTEIAEIQNQLESVKKEYSSKLSEALSNERILSDEIIKFKREMLEEKDKRMRIENESLDNRKYHEAEIQLRLKFESKLNSMHAIHRDLNTKFNQVLENYKEIMERNSFLESKYKHLDTDVKKLRVTKVELDSKVTNDKEHIDLLTTELSTKTELLDDLTRKLNKIQMEKDQNYHDFNVYITENIALK